MTLNWSQGDLKGCPWGFCLPFSYFKEGQEENIHKILPSSYFRSEWMKMWCWEFWQLRCGHKKTRVGLRVCCPQGHRELLRQPETAWLKSPSHRRE